MSKNVKKAQSRYHLTLCLTVQTRGLESVFSYRMIYTIFTKRNI